MPLLQRLCSPLTSAIGRVVLGGAVLVILLGGALQAEAKRVHKAPGAPASDHQADCRKDADCVLVPDDCCSCAEGGKQHALPKSRRDAYQAERKSRCAGTMCPQMMSTDPSCAQQAVCRAGACQLADGTAR